MEKTLTRREELVHTLVLILCAVIWGSAFVAQSIGAEFVGPFTFLALRNWVAMIFLLPVILLRDRVIAMKGGISDAPANRYQWKMLVLGGMSCGTFLFLASVSQQAGISLTTTAKAGFITAQYVVIVPLISVFFGKKVRSGIWLCVALSVTGLYLLCMNGPLELGTGDSLMLLCAFLFALQIICVDHFSPMTDPVRLSFAQFFMTALLATVGMLLFEPLSVTELKAAAGSIVYAGVMSSGVAYTLQIVGQQNLNPTVASLSMSLESVFSAICGWIVLGQALHTRELAGCGLMFAAIVLSQL